MTRVPLPRSAAGATALLLFLLAATPVWAQTPEWEGAPRTTVIDGLAGPIDFALAPDGSVWWNEYYTGNVNRYDPQTGVREVMFHAPPIEDGVERGIVGLALDRDVATTGVFYVYYTVADPDDPSGGTNRLSRVQDGEETVLLTVPAAVLHNGGRILVAPDGSLFVSTGDNSRDEGRVAQDPSSPLGKILHLHPDGRPAEGNIEGYVYSMGHRNVYGLAFDVATGRLFATENNNAERDEVNLIQAGGNYGWPHCEGLVRYDAARGVAMEDPCDRADVLLPIGEFYPDTTAAPTGAAILHGELYWASWNQGAIHRLTQDPATCAWEDEVVFRPGGRINDMEAGQDGASMYYSNWTHIMRLDVPMREGAAERALEAADACDLAPLTQPEGDPDKEGPGVGFVLLAGALLLALTAGASGRRR